MDDQELFSTLGPQHAGDLEDAAAFFEALKKVVEPQVLEDCFEAAVSDESLFVRLKARAKAIRELNQG